MSQTFLSVTDCAKAMQISRSTLHRALRPSGVTLVKVGGAFLLSSDDVKRIEAYRCDPTQKGERGRVA